MSDEWSVAEIEDWDGQEWEELYGEDGSEREDELDDDYFPRPHLTPEEAAADMRKWNTILGLVGLAIVGCLVVAFCAWVVSMCGGCLG